jgi:hypothetical protein
MVEKAVSFSQKERSNGRRSKKAQENPLLCALDLSNGIYIFRFKGH